MINFLELFKVFCQEKYPKSHTGTAASYFNAIKYLLQFLEAEDLDERLILEIKSLEPDIRDEKKTLYKELINFFIDSGRRSYLEKGFLKAALPVLFDFWSQSSEILKTNLRSELVLLHELKDKQVESLFNLTNIKGQIPLPQIYEHNYKVRKISGTTNDITKKIISGRRAEKYFISYLANLGFLETIDYIDVANNKKYGYDLRFLEMGIEIKNIKNGGFYLTDNEIARLENTDTHLILIDIDNGIWVLLNKSLWLKDAILGIKEIRGYCKSNYSKLDLSDIRINLDKNISDEIIEISKYSKNEVIRLLNK